MNVARRILIVLGLLVVFTFIASVGGLAANHMPQHFVASSDQVGSEILLHLIGAIPLFIAAAITGAIAGSVFSSSEKAWSIATAGLLVASFMGGYSQFLSSGAVEPEDVVGLTLAAAAILACYFFVFRVARRLGASKEPAG